MTMRANLRVCWSVGAAIGMLGPGAAVPARAQCEAGWATHLPTVRVDADAVFDSTRRRLVLFGGVDGATYRNDTWEHDGAAWRLAAAGGTGVGPSARRGHKMVFDPLRGRTLMIGGYTGASSSTIETWAWDGATWRLFDAGLTGPAYAFTTGAGVESAAVFDQARSRVVMVLANGQTWELPAAGGGWQLVWSSSQGGPSARRGMALGYDRIRGRVRLFGGVIGSTRLADLWEWNGSAWTQITVSGSAPAARSEARMVYDPATRRIIMYGGAAQGGARLRDTWALSTIGAGAGTTTWTAISLVGSNTPAGGSGNTMVLDTARRRLVLIGGNAAPWTDICTLDLAQTGSAWTQVQFGPMARSGMAYAYDQHRRRAVIFGGLGGSRMADTWEFDGSEWRPITVAGPSARNEAAMAYDPIRRNVVLFGGNTGSVNGETWEYDGLAQVWVQRAVSGPSPRERHSMAFDPVRGGIVLHGGAVSGGASNNQTWLWNGATWTQIATGPTRAGHAMAYYPPLGRMVLYGGSGAGTSQTAFAFDGAAWSAIGGTGPNPSVEATLTFDPSSQQLVLVGASSSDAAAWSFNGVTWRRSANSAGTARARVNHAAWYDDARARIVTYGGTSSSTNLRETWEYRGISGPVVISSPAWHVSCPSGAASFTVRIAPTSVADSVTWLRNGAVITPGATLWGSVVSMVTAADGKGYTLNISGIAAGDSGGYQCVLTSACGGGTATNPAFLRVCEADFNCSGSGAGDGVSEQDLFDFLTAWFSGDPRADINRSGDIGVQDLFDFMALFFSGC